MHFTHISEQKSDQRVTNYSRHKHMPVAKLTFEAEGNRRM